MPSTPTPPRWPPALDVLIAARPTDGIGRVGNGRRIAILGDMLELGPTEIDLHAPSPATRGLTAIATIHCVGPRMKALHEALPRGQRGLWVETAPELAARARSLFDAGDILLVKGSKGIKVSLVVDALRKLGQKPPPKKGPSECCTGLPSWATTGGSSTSSATSPSAPGRPSPPR
jgi:UDP-N-acetylmuramoyl-tripeptide--D-alanyl-D-alanine ligase